MRSAWADRDGRGNRRDVLDVIRENVDEFLIGLDAGRGPDPLLTPWRRTCRDAIRTASGVTP